MNPSTPLGALVVSTGGALASGLGALAQAAEGAGPALAPYVTGGGSAVSVAALVWVVKKAFSGDFVVKPVAEYQQELAVMNMAMADREDRAVKTAEKVVALVERQARQQEEIAQLMWRVNEHLGGKGDQRRTRRTQQ